MRNKVELLIREVSHKNELTDSHLRKETAKGKFMSRVMSYNFISEVGLYLAKKANFNLASLYLFKYAFSELSAFKGRARAKENVINHSEWANFTSTPEFENCFTIIDRLLAQFSKVFEGYYNSIIGPISQARPDVAQGVTSNLGSGPLAPINPEIPIYELKTNWIGKLGNTPEDYFTKMEILVVIELLRGTPLSIDFCALELMKKSATVQQIVQIFEDALKAVNS